MNSSKVIGGLNPPEHIDKDKAELFEPRKERTPDRLDGILKAHLRCEPGPYILDKTFYSGGSRELRVDFDVTFTRFYPALDLLVHSFSRRMLYTNLNDEEVEKDRKAHADYAKSIKMQFLPIMDGEVAQEDLDRISIPKRGAVVPKRDDQKKASAA